MANINSFPKDNTINGGDAWIGTDSINRQTKQYTASSVGAYINSSGLIAVNSQMKYKFTDTPFVESGSIAFSSGAGSGTSFSSITELVMSNADISGQTVVGFLEYLVDDEIIIADQGNIQSFGHYAVDSYTVDPLYNSFHKIGLTYIGGSGTISNQVLYNIANFSLANITDQVFIFDQPTAAAVWTINHPMNKFPSISPVDETDQGINGEYKYIDKNNLTITFSIPVAGKAYLN